MRNYNVYLRKDGRWEGRIYMPENKTRKRKYRSFFGKTREEAERKISAYIAELKNTSSASATLGQVFSEWLGSVTIRVKEATIANYTMKARKHILPVFGEKQILDISAESVYRFIETKQKEDLSGRYIADIIVLMKSIFKYAAKMYHFINPLDGMTLPKKKTTEIRLLDTEQQNQLLQHIQKHTTATTLGVALSLFMGLRIGELCALQWSDVDLKKRILTVRKTVQRIQCSGEVKKTKLVITEPKSESSKRIIPIPDALIPLISCFQSDTDNYILSGTKKLIEPRTMQYRFCRILNNVNLPSVHFHALRHMFASNCIRLGFDVKSLSELLGHSSVEITMNRYVHSSLEDKKIYMNRIRLAI